jgi:ferredoxin
VADGINDEDGDDAVKAEVDRHKCQGMALCEALDAQRFQVQGDGKMHVLQPELADPEALEVAREAVITCPNDAISFVDE